MGDSLINNQWMTESQIEVLVDRYVCTYEYIDVYMDIKKVELWWAQKFRLPTLPPPPLSNRPWSSKKLEPKSLIGLHYNLLSDLALKEER